jgi:hypothetical protein
MFFSQAGRLTHIEKLSGVILRNFHVQGDAVTSLCAFRPACYPVCPQATGRELRNRLQ